MFTKFIAAYFMIQDVAMNPKPGMGSDSTLTFYSSEDLFDQTQVCRCLESSYVISKPGFAGGWYKNREVRANVQTLQ